MPLSPVVNTNPGVYAGPGQAPLLRCGEQITVWQAQGILAGTTTSLAVQVEWLKSGFFYVPKLSVELVASGAPGTFEVDVQFAETDKDANYISNSTLINAVNTSNVARWDLPAGFFPRYARLFAKTWPNPVTITAVISH
jgi:predicted RecA/RadA family phage recombinase